MQISRFHVVLAFVALMLLRITVGFHFFKEGTDKIQNGFTAEYFLKAAKGPFAPYFHSMLDDPNDVWKFGLTENESGKKDVSPELSIALWDDFVDRAVNYYNFSDDELIQTLESRRDDLKAEIIRARESGDASVNTRELEAVRQAAAESIALLRNQKQQAKEILEIHVDELDYWFAVNRIELLAYFETADRVKGFDRDGASKEKVAVYVDSLRDQVTSISYDRDKQKNGWAGEVEAIWDSFESEINGLATDAQAKKKPLELHRPFKQSNSKLRWINQIIPWFDLTVGVLLMVGLFTRLASLCGAAFLLSVIATQPPWIPGTQPTYLYAIEFMALVVIFATVAGRMGGLDFFFSGWRSNSNTNVETE